jgi:hypothetical protein
MEPTTTAFAGAAEQVRMLASGATTSPELAELYLSRIARLDAHLNAYRVVRSVAARAEAVDAQRRIDAGERARRRPSDEATLLALSAQIEAAHPWAYRRPLIS